MHIIPLFSQRNSHLLNGKGIDNFKENLSGITDGHQNYEENDCQVKIVIGASKRTGM